MKLSLIKQLKTMIFGSNGYSELEHVLSFLKQLQQFLSCRINLIALLAPKAIFRSIL